MFDPQKPIDRTFKAFGSAATVETEADRSITVRDAAPDEDVSWSGATQLDVKTRVLEIRATEMGNIAKGSVIVIGSERLIVQERPKYSDPRRLIATINTRPAP